jgi:prepilin-type processing-associated H-X9-DG protein
MTSSAFLSSDPTGRRSRGFTWIEVLVAVAIVIVILTIAFPVITKMRMRTHRQTALEKIRTLGSALTTYANQNGGYLPGEDAEDDDTWQVTASPAANDTWYNALPRALGRRGAGDYGPSDFYTDENLLFLPGANYPDKKKFLKPQFAIAFNTKLQRKGEAGRKERPKLAQIAEPARTVVLLEQGLLNESRTLSVQTKTDYDGSPKGSAKSFVGRYDGAGVLAFADGHVQLVAVSDVLTATGAFPFPPTEVVWAATANENPNKSAADGQAKKKK